MKNFFAFIFFVLVSLPLCAAEVQEVKSAKGITAWLIEDNSLPIISIAFSWNGGVERDPEDKQGRAYLGANMLTQGAGVDNAAAFQKKLQENAISLNFNAARDEISGSMRSLKETWGTAQSLLKAAITSPRFDADALAREKANMISSLRAYRGEQDWLVSRLSFRELFKGHPYEKRTLGTEKTIAAITKADLQKWHGAFDRAHLQISVTGAISADELKKFLDDVFGDLPEKNAAAEIPEWKNGKADIWLLKHPGTQTEILFSWQGLKRDDPDWYVAEVMNYIFGGGGFSSRLTKEIREKRGLTYGISSGMMAFDHAALYSINASVKNESVKDVFDLVLVEAKKMQEAKVSPEELQAAKDYLIGAYPLQLTSTPRVAAHYLGLQQHGLPMDEEKKRADAIRAVTAEKVQQLAQRLMSADPSVFLVGEPSGMKPHNTINNIE